MRGLLRCHSNVVEGQPFSGKNSTGDRSFSKILLESVLSSLRWWDEKTRRCGVRASGGGRLGVRGAGRCNATVSASDAERYKYQQPGPERASRGDRGLQARDDREAPCRQNWQAYHRVYERRKS